MNAASLVIFLGLSTALLWGVSDFWAARASKAVGSFIAALLVNVLGSAWFLVLYFAVLHPVTHWSTAGIVQAIVSGLLFGLGDMIFFKALKIGPVSIASPISSAYPLFTTIMALLVFRVVLQPRQVIGIAMVLVGIFAAAELLTLRVSKLRQRRTGPLLALGAAILWGVSMSLLARAVNDLGWQSATLIESLSIGLGLLVIVPFVYRRAGLTLGVMRKALTNKFMWGVTLVQQIGVLVLTIGFAKDATQGAIMTAISACYPVLTIALALRHFKESVRLIPLAGAMLTIAGVILLSLN